MINRRVHDLVLQENYQIKNSDKTLDNTPTENHVAHQRSPRRHIPEVDREKESSTRRQVPDTQDKPCRVMYEKDRRAGNRRKELIYKNQMR
jgi:hypothetical protein